jgi:hypothetical protein
MSYNEKLAERIRRIIARDQYPMVTEIKMFGGLCWTLRGHMCCGVLKEDVVFRMPGKLYAQALSEPHVRPLDFSGKLIRGFVCIGPAATQTAAKLQKWIRRGADYALSLPPKYPRRNGARFLPTRLPGKKE